MKSDYYMVVAKVKWDFPNAEISGRRATKKSQVNLVQNETCQKEYLDKVVEN